MNTLGIRSCTGTGGGSTYLTGCLEVDVDILMQDVDIEIDQVLVDVTNPSSDVDIDVPVYTVDVTPGVNDVDVTIECVDINNEC